jgi:thymidylate kinase
MKNPQIIITVEGPVGSGKSLALMAIKYALLETGWSICIFNEDPNRIIVRRPKTAIAKSEVPKPGTL